jgi:hypothetical protein
MRCEKIVEGHVLLLERLRMAHRALNIRKELARGGELSVTDGPVLATRIDRSTAVALEHFEYGFCFAVDELGTELDRHRQSGFPMRVNSAADALTCVDQDDTVADPSELGGRCKTRGAGADNRNIIRRRSHAPEYRKICRRLTRAAMARHSACAA